MRMTETQFLQLAGEGHPRTRVKVKYDALAEYLRSHGLFEIASVVDSLHDKFEELYERLGQTDER